MPDVNELSHEVGQSLSIVFWSCW